MQPLNISDRTAIGAGVTTPNLITVNRERFARVPYDCIGELILLGELALQEYEFKVDATTITDQNAARIDASGVIRTPDDIQVAQFFARENALMVLKGINPGAASLIDWRINLVPWEPDGEGEEPPPRELVTQLTGSLAAGASVRPLANRIYERPRVDSFLEIFATGSAVGLTMETVIGTQSISEPVSISPANRLPIDPFDVVLGGIQVPSDKKVDIRINNPTGGPITWNLRTKFREAFFLY